MNLFYNPTPEDQPYLSGDESRHCIKVLRKIKGDSIQIVDGVGGLYDAIIADDSAKRCTYEIINKTQFEKPETSYIHIAIAPTKNNDRIEWFVEKVCELGIDEITFIKTNRGIRKSINVERLEKKTISALKQSKNLYKTIINPLARLSDLISQSDSESQKFIAFVDHDNDKSLYKLARNSMKYLVLIGPEGDFTDDEVKLSTDAGFHLVNLGNSVLRTETAGLIAAHTLKLINQ